MNIPDDAEALTTKPSQAKPHFTLNRYQLGQHHDHHLDCQFRMEPLSSLSLFWKQVDE
jgi:hypothetical protein